MKKVEPPRGTQRGADRRKHSLARASGAVADGTPSTLFETARMQWQFGDWESLAAIGRPAVEGDSRRAMLALFIASAHLQVGDHASARNFVEAAVEWGCDRTGLARILIAGASNTLGRIAAVRGQEGRALGHFRNAIDGVEGDQRLACQARSISEIARLDLVDQTVRMMKVHDLPHAGRSRPPSIRIDRKIALRELLLEASSRAPDAVVDAGLNGYPARRSPPGVARGAIVVAGMRHSGSTALFNILRLALEQRGLDFVSFYSEGARSEHLHDPDVPLLLVKTHEFRDDIAARADIIITTRRDLRDTVASAKRRGFPTLKRLDSAVEYAKYNRALHDVWREHSDYEFVYEAYMASPVMEIGKLLRFIGLDDVDAGMIHEAVTKLSAGQYETSLLSTVHITDPGRVLSFEDSLSEPDVARINSDNGVWLQRYGYEPANGRQ